MVLTARAVIALIFITLAFVDSKASCPPVNQVRGPECRENYECHKGPCCPNYLGKKSCVNTVSFKFDSVKHTHYENERASLQKRGVESGVYCNGVKCMPYQQCKPDRFTGKLRCQ